MNEEINELLSIYEQEKKLIESIIEEDGLIVIIKQFA
ncbi:hypothetical protein FHT21_003977 [Pedobacter sp. SG908]|nr:hypothetical protein [Pedobacter sp. SG908]